MILSRRLAVAVSVVLIAGCSAASTSRSPAASEPSINPSAAPSPTTASSLPLPSGGPLDLSRLTVKLEEVVDGLAAPLAVVSPRDGSGRLFVAEQGGTIRIVEDGRLLPEPFLDVSQEISAGGERGLLGLAFHPNFPDDQRFFVNYTDTNGDTHIAAFVVDPENPDVADPGSEQQLVFVDQPYANHNGGGLAFGPDGYLYAGLGDGGGGGDPHGNGQKLSTMLGKILRIDVDDERGNAPYAIPPDNPFAGIAGDEPAVFHYGLRNPWRFSFDRATGDLWIGDVGQSHWEEIDVARAGTSGLDFGWNRMEGTHCFRPESNCDETGLTMPLAEYSHQHGCTVIGGYVYRGTAQPILAGAYLFTDYCSGTIWALDAAGDGLRDAVEVGQTGATLSSFGEDEDGELYATALSPGALLHVVATRS
jgi:glucose/arabinose dehydrogenase